MIFSKIYIPVCAPVQPAGDGANIPQVDEVTTADFGSHVTTTAWGKAYGYSTILATKWLEQGRNSHSGIYINIF